jgi:sugar/nucleoside kinase (ribokinase family)
MMALVMAESNDLRVVLDPGGLDPKTTEIIKSALHKVFLLKPNEHETEMLTGIRVEDMETAGKAARVLMDYGVQHVFITHGVKGGYLFGKDVSIHIAVPEVKETEDKDATGCGDQVTATITTALVKGFDMVEAARYAINAGTIQFNRPGISTVTYNEIFE